MIKKVLVLSIAICFISCSIAFATTKSNCGCGVGTMIFEKNDGLVFQVLAATTNGCFGNQTFGITSGTLECEKPATFAKRERLNKFVASNMDNLARDIAKGQGEFIEAVRLVVFGDGDSLQVQTAEDTSVRFMLIAGAPFNEPIVPYGPFVMNTQAEIQQAFVDLRNGTFVTA